jgi:hypothetical protein
MNNFLRLPFQGSNLYFLLSLLFFLIISLPARAQEPVEAWSVQYGSALPTSESGAMVTTDAAGNTYVVGTSSIAGMEPQNRSVALVVVKYNPIGEEVWRYFYRDDYGVWPGALTVDETGLYVVASNSQAAQRTFPFLLKLDLMEGNLLWSVSLEIGRYSAGTYIFTDGMGGLILAGDVNLLFLGTGSYIAKHRTTDGQQVWEQLLMPAASPSSNQVLADVAVDDQGDIYVVSTQTREGTPQTRAVTSKYRNADGGMVWEQFYETSKNDRALHIALDGQGAVYSLMATYQTEYMTPDESVLIKYNTATGGELWLQEVIGTGLPGNLTADGAGGLYLSATVQQVRHIVKYTTATGTIAWLKPLQGTLVGIEADDRGNAYVAANTAQGNYLVRRYNASSGEIDWEQLSAGGENFNESLTDLAVSEAGFVHLGGTYTETGSGVSKIIIASHHASSGAQVFKTTFPGTIPGADYPTAITIDSEGNIYIAGRGGGDVSANISEDIIVIKYSPAGELLWAKKQMNRLGGAANSIAVDVAGNVYVLGTWRGSDGRPDAVLLKYTGETGDLVWEKEHGPGQANSGREMKLDQQGFIYITGKANSMFDVRSQDFILKIDPETGESIWGENYSAAIGDADLHDLVSFAVDEADHVYVTGTRGSPGVANEIVLVKYAGTNGSIDWLETYNSGNRQTLHQVTGVAVDHVGDVYLAALSDLPAEQRESYLLKYSASTGEQLWLQPSPDQGTTPGRLDFLTLDNAGGAYVGGFINGVWHIIKFNTAEPGIAWYAPYLGQLTAIETDNAGGVYATGISNNNILTTKYRAADGSKVWEVLKEANSDVALLALDPANNVIVTGTIFSRETNFDILIVKYNQTAEPICNIPVQVQLYLAPYAIRAGWQVRTTADFGDYILTENTGVRWTWGDGTEPSISYTAFGTSRITGQHTYERAGIYRVGLDFEESCLVAANNDYEQWQIIYDPEAGNVVGAGWQNSPQGVYPLMTSSGRLLFAFGVRYNGRHTTSPQGHLLLQLTNQSLFRSSTVEWLVITGNSAIWKGIGSVQGQGRYGYVVSVQDAGRRGLNDPNDQLRIRIWDMDRGNAIVYDNFELGGDIYNLAGTAGPTIERGNIVINGRSILDELFAQNTNSLAGIEQQAVRAYPNPASAFTTISFVSAEDSAFELQLYDMRGALVKQVHQGFAQAGAQTEVKVDVSSLGKGMYLARISSAGGTKTVKVLVER